MLKPILAFTLLFAACLVSAPLCRAQTTPRVDVVIGGNAPALERFAASELCDYLAKLYGIHAHPAHPRGPFRLPRR